MDIQSLKQYIYDNHKIEYVLEKLGCHNIKHNAKHDYYSAAQKDGDNPMGVVINNNRYLNYISYSRNVTPEQHKDIVDLVQSTNKIDFVDALKWLHGIFDLDFSICSKPKKIITDDDDDCDLLSIFRNIREQVDVNDIQEIQEEELDLYEPIVHIKWFQEGIMPWAAKKFGLCYSYKHHRMIIPLRYWLDGRLLGFNQRTMIDNWKELGIPKYFITVNYKKSINLYGLWENKKTIEDAGYVVVVESEKSVLKRYSKCDGTCVAIQGKVVSDEQERILRSLNVDEIVIAFDKDVCIDEVRCICERFYKTKKVSYIWDKYDLLGDKDSPCDADNKIYRYLFKHRVAYNSIEHQKYMQSLKKY